MKPKIDFAHVLKELVVNRKDPCEVVRELISNSYDALASEMWYLPLLGTNNQGFIFADNGSGLDTKTKVRGITPYEAFFSIGKSTKTFGKSIGYKCQGSKLCFASKRFLVISRCAFERKWRFHAIENPRDNLTEASKVVPRSTESPAKELSRFLSYCDDRVSSVVSELSDEWFHENLKTGTMIVVVGYNANRFDECFNPQSGRGKRADRGNSPEELFESSYIYNYIRFNTKHGDVQHLEESAGFSSHSSGVIRKQSAKPARLNIWVKDKYMHVPFGFPYLRWSTEDVLTPAKVAKISDARFQCRASMPVQHENQYFSFILSVDGNGRRLKQYSSLDRRGKALSGIRLTDQCGTFIASQGIKGTPYNQLFNNPVMEDRYGCLAKSEAQDHFTLIINGPFPLVTSRNDLAEDAGRILEDQSFLTKIRDFLEEVRLEQPVFRELLDRVQKNQNERSLDKQRQLNDDNRSKLVSCERFFFSVVEGGPEISFWSPDYGQEAGVVALYSTFSAIVQSTPNRVREEGLLRFWMRPLAHYARGVDALAQPITDSSPENAKLLEFKYSFGPGKEYNHPLCDTDVIVAWELDHVENDMTVTDEFRLFASVRLLQDFEPKLAYYLVNRQSFFGRAYPGTTLVISLRELIQRSFDVQLVTPPSEG